jgi:hypothetical protein
VQVPISTANTATVAVADTNEKLNMKKNAKIAPSRQLYYRHEAFEQLVDPKLEVVRRHALLERNDEERKK